MRRGSGRAAAVGLRNTFLAQHRPAWPPGAAKICLSWPSPHQLGGNETPVKGCSLIPLTPNAPWPQTGNTALHYAAANGHSDAVEALLKAKPDSVERALKTRNKAREETGRDGKEKLGCRGAPCCFLSRVVAAALEWLWPRRAFL